MAKKQGTRNQKSLVVSIRHMVTTDSNGRLSRTIDILLRAAARGASQSKGNPGAKREEPLRQDPATDDPTGGNECEG